jgi:hypothetical protein
MIAPRVQDPTARHEEAALKGIAKCLQFADKVFASPARESGSGPPCQAETGIRTMEIQRELLPGEILELPRVLTERAQIDGNRAKTGVNCESAIGFSSGLFPGREKRALRLNEEHPFRCRNANRSGCRWKRSLSSGPAGPYQGGASRPVG